MEIRVICDTYTMGLWKARASGFALILIAAVTPLRALAQAVPAARGFTYQHDEIHEKPWSIHIVKVDRSNPRLELQTTLGGGDRIGVGTLSQQIRTLPASLGRAVAGINGDYFRNEYPYEGDPKGLQIMRGELVSGPKDWTCCWVDAAREPHMTNVIAQFEVTWPGGEKSAFVINEERKPGAVVLFTPAIGPTTQTSGGRELILERDGTNCWLPLRPSQTYSARVREVRESGDTPLTRDTMVLSLGRKAAETLPKLAAGTTLTISTATTPSLDGVDMAIGGGPPLVRAGTAVGHELTRIRHPRSAFGWNKSAFFLVEVDGRQRYLSVGMTMVELSEYMVKLGCEEAMCLDGGGSATCWVTGQVMNSPSEGHERPMANALVVVQKK
jgi:hypothetical protein